LAALIVLIACLLIISRKNNITGLANTTARKPELAQTGSPVLTVQTQIDAPLVISAPRILSIEEQYVEIAFELTNVSNKAIRTYAIKQEVEGDPSTKLSLSNLDLTNSPRLNVNRSVTNFDTFDLNPSKETHVSLSVDYVEFSDGARWGTDSAQSADRSEGQRAAAQILSKRLLAILYKGDPRDVMNAIDAGKVNIDPPIQRSQEWKEGFRMACNSTASHLKRVQSHGDPSEVDRELRQLSEHFSGRR